MDTLGIHHLGLAVSDLEANTGSNRRTIDPKNLS